MPKYDVADNHTWMLKMPRFTSDHLNLSSRSSAVLENQRISRGFFISKKYHLEPLDFTLT